MAGSPGFQFDDRQVVRRDLAEVRVGPGPGGDFHGGGVRAGWGSGGWGFSRGFSRGRGGMRGQRQQH